MTGIERRADELFAAGMSEHSVPGGVLVLVQNGTVVLARSYGFADVQGRVPVTPDTVFRVGSLSKLVTAMAAMLLVERGRLSLDDDVRPLLPELARSGRVRAPLSLAHLLTHTSGLDVTNVGVASPTPEGVLPLERVVAERLPPQVFSPGEVYHYSNQGYAVVGRLIERITGQRFAASVSSAVFEPLVMRHSTFEQPASDSVRAKQATGYELEDGLLVSLPLNFSQVAPADALQSTGADMARFISAHLGHQPLLAPETRSIMHATRFTYHSCLPGMTLGFHEELIGARRGIAGTRRLLVHTGGQLGFTSELGIVPEIDFGWFIAINRRVSRMRQDVMTELLAELLPQGLERPATTATAARGPLGVAGTYLSLSAPQSTIERIPTLLNPAARIHVDVDSTEGIVASGLGRLRPLSHRAFESEDGRRLLAFDSSRGRLFVDLEAFERVPLYRDPALHRIVALVSFSAMVLTLLGSSFGGRRAHHRQVSPAGSATLETRVAGPAVMVAHGLLVVFTVGLGAELVRVSGLGWKYGLPPRTRTLFAIPVVAVVATGVSAVCAARLWWKRSWPFRRRAAYSGAVATAIVYLGLLAYWNVLGPSARGLRRPAFGDD